MSEDDLAMFVKKSKGFSCDDIVKSFNVARVSVASRTSYMVLADDEADDEEAPPLGRDDIIKGLRDQGSSVSAEAVAECANWGGQMEDKSCPLFVLGDQPFSKPRPVNELIQKYRGVPAAGRKRKPPKKASAPPHARLCYSISAVVPDSVYTYVSQGARSSKRQAGGLP